jgi:hypothetical protein
MKALIGSLTALALIATPAVAAQTKSAPAKAAAAKPAKSVAKEAKVERESTATEAKEHRAAARHHHAARCSCPSKYAKAHKTTHKMAVKKTTTTTPKTKG